MNVNKFGLEYISFFAGLSKALVFAKNDLDFDAVAEDNITSHSKARGKRRFRMSDHFKKAGAVLTFLFFLMAFGAVIVQALDLGPRDRTGRTRRTAQQVAEPAAIALLGAGLVSLGIYAKKKRAKKQ